MFVIKIFLLERRKYKMLERCENEKRVDLTLCVINDSSRGNVVATSV